jgi:hypothetical protein
METIGQDRYSRNTSRCRWKMNGEKAPICIASLVGCRAAPRCVSGIEIATNEKAISGSREAKIVVPLVRNFLR